MSEREIFEAALDQPLEGRAAFVDRACAGDAEMLGRIKALLDKHDRAGSFLEEPLGTSAFADRDGAAAPNPKADAAGQVLAGRYKLLQLIGTGGMGSVWMAQQHEPVQRQVEVKLIRAGLDSSAVHARFEAERQALAVMDHPNIAKVFDGGFADDGRPFFVMELVKGVPITKYCDEH